VIQKAFVIRDNGDTLFSVDYADDAYDGRSNKLPSFVQACVALFHSRESTAHGTPYTLDHGEMIWAYSFFDSFTIVLLITADEDMDSLKRRMVSLGNELTRSYGNVIQTWDGNIGEIQEIDGLVDMYMRYDFNRYSSIQLSDIERFVDSAIEKYDLAFAGVLDAFGSMIKGNIPDSHLSRIQNEITNGTIKFSVDIIPTAMQIRGYTLQLLKVQSLTVATASHKDGKRISATQAASEIGQFLDEAMS